MIGNGVWPKTRGGDLSVEDHPEDFRAHPLFARSRNPMLVADDQRRYVDANAAACLFLRRSVDAIRKLKVDDLTPPAQRPRLDALWAEFLQGTLVARGGPCNVHMPDGTTVAVNLSATAHFRPGRHLAIVLFPAQSALDESVDRALPQRTNVLTRREREVLRLVALGETGIEIASRLFLSPATVQSHVANALIKLGAKNRAHGITLALRHNELDLDDPDE